MLFERRSILALLGHLIVMLNMQMVSGQDMS
jgi:hypothetical protein